MNINVKQAFETVSIGALCTVFVLSMHQSCSGLSEKFAKKEEKKEINKAQELKNDTIRVFRLEQKVR